MVTRAHSPRLAAALQVYALLGAPLAWATQLVLGYGYTEAACGPGVGHWGIGIGTWEALLAVAAAAIAAGGWASAAVLHAATGRGEIHDPLGRVRFVSTIGLAVGGIFVTLIVFTGAGVLALGGCRPS
jgi:hypothetical protein